MQERDHERYQTKPKAEINEMKLETYKLTLSAIIKKDFEASEHSQAEFCRRVQWLHPGDLSNILGNDVRRLTVDRLFRIVLKLGYDIKIEVT